METPPPPKLRKKKTRIQVEDLEKEKTDRDLLEGRKRLKRKRTASCEGFANPYQPDFPKTEIEDEPEETEQAEAGKPAEPKAALTSCFLTVCSSHFQLVPKLVLPLCARIAA